MDQTARLDGPASDALLKLGRFFTDWDETDDGRAVFRKGGDCTFLVEELKAVFDPKGGYFKRGGRFMPSLVAEIGECIEKHLIDIGMLQPPELSEHQKRHIEEKRVQFETRATPPPATEERNPYPAGAQLCNKCMTKAMIMMDGCMTCLSCGDSKCG